MKSFTVDTCDRVRDGIALKHDPYPHIPVGGTGPGRRGKWIPAGRDDFGETERLDRCHNIVTKGKGTTLIVRENRRDDRHALVLVKIRGGNRGSAYLRTEDGHILHQVEDSVRRAYGIQLLEYGHDSEGADGRSGGPHHQALLVLDEGACVQVERLGRLLDDGPTKCWIRWMPDRAGLRVGSLSDIFPDPAD